MRVLFKDRVKDNYSTITSTYESANYPASNLKDIAAKKRYQMTTPSGEYDTVTLTLDDYYYINNVWLTYSNAGKFVIRVYNDATLIDSTTLYCGDSTRITTDSDTRITTDSDTRITSLALGQESLVWYNTAGMINKIEIDVYGGVGYYLGKVGAGEYATLPSVSNSWGEGFVLNSDYVQSLDGQTRQKYFKALKEYDFTFPFLEYAQVNTIENYLYTYGKGAPCFVDPFEDDTTAPYHKKMYAVLDDVSSIKHDTMTYDISMKFTEAR